MLVKRILLFLVVILLLKCQALQAQSPVGTSGSYAKLANEPISLFAGTPSVTIPIGELSGRKLTIPIYLSYHSSGIKVDELASWVGLGWNLQAGGVITRSIKGKPDRYSNYYMSDKEEISTPFLKNATTTSGAYDTEPDIFYFNLNGRSGTFVLDEERNPHCIPYQDIKITAIYADDNERLDLWEIITEDGTKYFYGGLNSNEHTADNVNISWYLKQIISPNAEDTITFNYVREIFKYDKALNLSRTYIRVYESCHQNEDDPGCPPPGIEPDVICDQECYHYYGFADDQVNTTILYSSRLVSIESSLGSVYFKANTYPREDVRHDIKEEFEALEANGQLTTQDGLPYALQEIVFNDKDTNPFRKILFNIEYRNYRLWLNSIMESTEDYTSYLPPYKFEYVDILLPELTSSQKDYYGLYNGPIEPITINILDHWTTNVKNRRVDPSYGQAGILKQISYPDGGIVEYFYSGNKFRNLLSTYERSGIRVDSIKSSNVDGSDVLTTEFIYTREINEDAPFVYNTVEYVRGFYCDDEDVDTMIVVDEGGTTQFSHLLGYEDGYSSVKVKKTYLDPVTRVKRSEGSVIYEYTSGADTVSKDSYSVSFVWDEASDNISNNDHTFNYQQPTSKNWRRGLLLRKSILNEEGTLLKKEDFTYNFEDVNANFNKEVKALQIEQFSDPVAFKPVFHHKYGCNYYTVSTGRSNMVSKTVTVYDKNGENPIETTTEYFYESNNYNQLSKVTSVDNQEDTLETKLYYPETCDTTDLDENIQTDLLGKNIINPVIKKESYKAGERISGQKTNLGYFFNSTFILPDSSSVFEDGEYKGKSFIDEYNEFGNIIQAHGESGVSSVVIYDQDNIYAIARVANAGHGEVFHENFENENGNTETCRTGKSGFTGNYDIELPDVAGDYSLTYWKYINDTWTLEDETRTVSSADDTCRISGTIDDIRVHPVDAFMSTTTIDPIYGKTSETNVNHRTTYYEYDDLGRLIIIRDHDKNIVTKNEFNQKPFFYVGSNKLDFKAADNIVQKILVTDLVFLYKIFDRDKQLINATQSMLNINKNENWLEVSCTENSSFVEREEYIVIEKDGVEYTIYVFQDAYQPDCNYSIKIAECNGSDIGINQTFNFHFNADVSCTGYDVRIIFNGTHYGPFSGSFNCNDTSYNTCELYSGDTVGTKSIIIQIVDGDRIIQEESHSIIVYPNN